MLKSVINDYELFDIVDKNDNVIQVWLKESELHLNDDITRVVTTYIFDENWRVYIAQRSPEKIADPLKFEAPSHWRVNSWELYDQAARRETMEELWVDLVDLEEVNHYYVSFDTNVWLRQHYKKLFIWNIKSDIKINKQEIYKIESFDDIHAFFDFFEKNVDLFSSAIWYDLMHLKKHFNI